jgi:hypothetical protein
VQHFGDTGLHATAVSGGQNNDLEHSEVRRSGFVCRHMIMTATLFASVVRAIAQQTPEIKGIRL